MVNKTQARRLVENIFEAHGYVPQEIWDQMSPEVRTVVKAAMLRKDEMIASSVKTLAKHLYTSSARFVFELLQNCDDNHYHKARAKGDEPYVSFNIYPDRIIVECNEDGFLPENLTAICDVGKSSKSSGAQGYIGEKGIGFKSVFMAAHEVHIQSGDFSFFFRHREGDSGMGMITPFWEDRGDEVANQLTRITLLLRHDGDPDVLETRRQTIRQQFRDIQGSILLFMKNMKKIDIAFYGNDKEKELTIALSINRQTDTRVVVHKSTVENGEEQLYVRHYHMTRHVATNLAENDNREYSGPEKQDKIYSKSEVVLAFPLEDNSPLLENQWVFAFLPVRQMGFKFLIQADFVTQANRQDIVTTSARNRGLADGIAEAFIKAVLQFCDLEKLQYQWMRFLPQKDEYAWDPFWTSLIDKIGDRLKRTPILRPAKPGPLRYISALTRQDNNTIDKYGKPLFADIAPECYLCLDYQDEDLNILEKHGLGKITMPLILDRVKHDLAAPDSRMKSIEDEDWHSRTAKLLNLPFEKSSTNGKMDVKRLSLLPLRDGRWSSIESGTVYYPRVKYMDVDIPADLKLNVLHTKPVDNKARNKLFHSIGVTDALPSSIREAIFELYSTKFRISDQNAASHLRFLYLTEHFVEPPYNYDRISLKPEKGSFDWHHKVDFYIRDGTPYGAGELLKPINSGPNQSDDTPGFDVLFVHGVYFEDELSPQMENSLSWKDWFQKHFHIRRNLRLVHSEKNQLSDMCKYVAEYRPDKFVGFLRAIWQVEPPSLSQEKDIIEELSKLEVLCIGGAMCPLKSTYLPFKRLQQLCRLFLLGDEFFPWLQLEIDLNYDTFPPEWQKLGEIFGLGLNQSDTTIILDILRYLLDQNISAGDLIKPERAYELYIYLQAEVRKSSEPNSCENEIQKYFALREAIFVPESGTQEAAWALPGDCVWESPIEMTTKHSLAGLYEMRFEKFNTDRSNLASFFGKTLEIPDCTWKHLVVEIRAFKASNCTDFDRISALYLCLASKCVEADISDELREIFQSEALICGFDNQATSWHKTTQCLWTSATQIREMCTLKELYSDLRDFFTKILRVKTMTIKMVYEKLIGPALSESEVRQTLETFNSLLLAAEGSELDPNPVLQKEIFPVRFPGGEIRLLKGSDSFALLDRESLGNDFGKSAKFFDFSIEKTRVLHPFIKWSRIEDRYLSKSVTENSFANEETTGPISSPDREIKLKAQALLSIAVTYNSPRARGDRKSFYNLLRTAKTLETDKITSELRLCQDGDILKIQKASAMLHIQEDKASLKVYLPRNERSQEFCFNSKLPRRLGEWIMTDPVTRIEEPVNLEFVTAIQSVLSVKCIALLDVLDDHGITLVNVGDQKDKDFENENDLADCSETRTFELSSEELVQHRSNRGRSSMSDSDDPVIDTPPSSVYSPSVRTSNNEEPCSASAVARHASLRPGLPHLELSLPNFNQYSALLSRVVEVARTATFPSRGVYNMSAMHAALEQIMLGEEDTTEPFRLRSITQIERDKQIGAAGELFSFELLSHLSPSLSNFSIANWQSTIRSYVTSHREYSNISPWRGREKADIMYTDNNSTLTGLLIDKGYLPSNIWAGAKPLYYIEVKTTTGSCETPFYMSKYQYNRMRDLCTSNTETRQTNSIYVIFRVFNLGSDHIGLKVLVDPEAMRLREELAFTEETWSVISRV